VAAFFQVDCFALRHPNAIKRRFRFFFTAANVLTRKSFLAKLRHNFLKAKKKIHDAAFGLFRKSSNFSRYCQNIFTAGAIALTAFLARLFFN
jgi:hypothetical protein